ncbi:hypothetical protein P7C70_g9482, partial [Phenoliferia sp. Uapishka_3]
MFGLLAGAPQALLDTFQLQTPIPFRLPAADIHAAKHPLVRLANCSAAEIPALVAETMVYILEHQFPTSIHSDPFWTCLVVLGSLSRAGEIKSTHLSPFLAGWEYVLRVSGLYHNVAFRLETFTRSPIHLPDVVDIPRLLKWASEWRPLHLHDNQVNIFAEILGSLAIIRRDSGPPVPVLEFAPNRPGEFRFRGLTRNVTDIGGVYRRLVTQMETDLAKLLDVPHAVIQSFNVGDLQEDLANTTPGASLGRLGPSPADDQRNVTIFPRSFLLVENARAAAHSASIWDPESPDTLTNLAATSIIKRVEAFIKDLMPLS